MDKNKELMNNSVIKQYELGLYEKSMPEYLAWETRFEAVKKSGFDFLELSIDETDMRIARLYDSVEQDEILAASLKQGVPIRSICLSAHRKYSLGNPDRKLRDKGLEIFRLAVDLASKLGVRTIQLAGYDVYYESSNDETVKLFYSGLKESIHYASMKSVVCAFESMETEFMNTVHKIMKAVEVIDSPYCQIYPDLGNLTNASLVHGDLYLDLDRGKGHYVAAHLKETIPGHFRNIQFGEGHVDFEKGVQKLWDLDVRCFVCECWFEENQNYANVIEKNGIYLRNYLDKMKEG